MRIADKRCAPRARTPDSAHGETEVRERWPPALASGEVGFPGACLLPCGHQTRLNRESPRGAGQDRLGKLPSTVPSVFCRTYLQPSPDLDVYDTHVQPGADLPRRPGTRAT